MTIRISSLLTFIHDMWFPNVYSHGICVYLSNTCARAHHVNAHIYIHLCMHVSHIMYTHMFVYVCMYLSPTMLPTIYFIFEHILYLTCDFPARRVTRHV